MRRLKVDHGSEPGVVQERARGVAFGEDRYDETGVDNSRGEPRTGEEDHLHQGWSANNPGGTLHGRAGRESVSGTFSVSSTRKKNVY